MRRARSLAEFRRSPIGTWIDANGSVIWCASPTLCGVHCYATPGATNVQQGLDAIAACLALPAGFDVLLDASRIASIDPVALDALLAWIRLQFAALQARIRRRVAVLPTGVAGLTLAGITHVLGGPGPDTIAPDARAAFRLLLPAGGDALCDEIVALVRELDATHGWLVELRALLIANRGSLALAAAAASLGTSARALQRGLAAAGSSYRREQRDARFVAAERLLASDEKLASIARRLGLSENGLNLLVRSVTGLTAGELRRRRRAT